MIIYSELERARKETIAANFKVLSWHLPARTVENVSFFRVVGVPGEI